MRCGLITEGRKMICQGASWVPEGTAVMIGWVNLSWHGSWQTHLGFAIRKPAAKIVIFCIYFDGNRFGCRIAQWLWLDRTNLSNDEVMHSAQTMKCGESTPGWKIQAIQHVQTIPISYAMFQYISCIIYFFHITDHHSFFSKSSDDWAFCFWQRDTRHSDLFPSSYQALVGCHDPFLQRGLIVIQAQLPFTMGGDVIQHHLTAQSQKRSSWRPFFPEILK